MKALEILKALSNGIIFAESLNIQIKEAITELEQLSSNSKQLKTCDNCKRCIAGYKGFDFGCNRLDFIVSKDWFCADWESKEC